MARPDASGRAWNSLNSPHDCAVRRTVIFHADDFGMNAAVNAGILRAFRDGCLTSTSLLVNAPAAEAALTGWRELERERATNALRSGDCRRALGDDCRPFELGLHLNLTQGRPLTDAFPAGLRAANGGFLSIGRLFGRLLTAGNRYAAELRAEIAAQVRWMGERGVTPSHVNGHQYVELIPAVSAAVADVLEAYQINTVRFPCEARLTTHTLLQGRPIDWTLALVKRALAVPYVRTLARRGFRGVPRYFGTAHAGRVTAKLVRDWVNSTPAGARIEIGVHPADGVSGSAPAGWDDPLSALRPLELAWLTSPELVATLHAAGCQLGRIAEDRRAE